jgi:ferredoxin-NADP reductase
MPGTDAAIIAPKKLQWMTATVREVIDETPRVRTLLLDVPDWPGHRAGQHVDARLTAEDGYRAQRSYSIASAPEEDGVALTVERIGDGEVSPYLTGEVRKGDVFELRGPIGGYFVWMPALDGPLFLIAGGSGVVPLMAMLRQRARQALPVPATLLFSSRTVADIIYRTELDGLAARADELTVVHTLTREKPADWRGFTRRIDRVMLQEVGYPSEAGAHCFICGPTPLVDLGHASHLIKTERFGPTGK